MIGLSRRKLDCRNSVTRFPAILSHMDPTAWTTLDARVDVSFLRGRRARTRVGPFGVPFDLDSTLNSA